MMLCATGISPPGRHRLGAFPRTLWRGAPQRAAHLGLGLIAFSLAAWSGAAGGEPSPSAPTYSVSIYNVYAGLPTNSAPLVKQTRDGYIWAGTELGLSRFDGARFVNFRVANTPELPSGWIREIYEDREGWTWIATQRGVCRYRQGKFERIGLEGTPVGKIVQDRAGSIWLSTEKKGLWEYRAGRLIPHVTADLAADATISVLYIDSHDRLWTGPVETVFWYDGHTSRLPELGPNLPFQTILRVVEAAGGVLWFETNKGIFRLRDGEFRHFGVEDGLADEQVRNLSVDRKGRLWVVMSSLYLMENSGPDRFVRIRVPGIDNTRSLMEDLEGNFWVGSAGDGIARLRLSGFRMVTPENGILGGYTRTVGVDQQGNAWAGLTSTGLARIEPNGTTSVISSGVGSVGEVWAVLPASDGRVWIGTRTSLRVWDKGEDREFPQFQKIRALFQDRSGAVWISSENQGVTRYKDGNFESMVDAILARQPPVNANALVPMAMAFAEDAEGGIFLGLRQAGGLMRFKDGVMRLFHANEGFQANDIRTVYPDREGNVWLGTKGRGLAVFTGGRWYNPEILSEAFNDQVSEILEDDQGRLWLGTPKGIVWAFKAQLLALARGEPASQNFRLASEGDGVRPAAVGAGSSPGACKARDGTLWFASRRGLVSIEPRNIAINTIPPPVQIEESEVDNKKLPIAEEIRLPPGTRALTLHYTALSFVGPNQVLFRYRLEGHDTQWTEAGTRRTAFYTNLEPGTFRFHVVACNDDGVWNETGASVLVVQQPFFYQTKWFYGLVALGLMGTGLGLFRWRTAALKRRNLELEQGIVERTAELAKSYEAIRASEYFYHSLVESLPQIIVRKDVEGRFTYANAGFGELIGRPLNQIIGQREADLYPPEKAEKFRADDQRAIQTHQTIEYETLIERKGQPPRYLHVKKVPLFNQQGSAMGVQILFWDMTTFREIEEKLKQAQHELVETSRLAGIAEMATGILHNLGNALNSVNITTNLAVTRLHRSKIGFIAKTAQLLTENADRLPEFFSTDPRGLKLPSYLSELANHLVAEHQEILAELKGLQASVDHIKDLVASQQQHAKVAGVTETVAASELVEYALRIGEAAMKRHGIAVVREFTAVPPVKVERQKALQIIGNLLANATDALAEAGRPDKRIALGVRASAGGGVQIYVTDNGIGIAPENLTKIFAFGFTTKKKGHGFGLHSSALAAKEIGGSLNGFSDGLGQGATFILELTAVKAGPPPRATLDQAAESEEKSSVSQVN